MGKAENVSIFFIHNTHLYTLKPPCQENPFAVIRNWKKLHCKLLGFGPLAPWPLDPQGAKGAKKSRPNTNCVRPALFGPFGPLRLDIDFLRPDIDILRPDIDIMRPDINIMSPDIDSRPKGPKPNKPGGQSLTSQGADLTSQGAKA